LHYIKALNSSSGQDMEFKINNTMYMQIYSNGVENIGNTGLCSIVVTKFKLKSPTKKL
jgi:hypothetical protein